MQHVQTRSTTSALVLTAVLIALATLFTMYTKIPVPGIRGYFNVGDVVIMTSALLLGRKYGAYIGAIGPALADLFLGYAVFVPIAGIVTNTIQAVMSVIISMILYAILRKRLG